MILVRNKIIFTKVLWIHKASNITHNAIFFFVLIGNVKSWKEHIC